MNTQVPIRPDAPNKKRARKTNNEKHQEIGIENERLLSRQQVALREGVSVMTIKRRERQGLLHALRFNRRLIRYRLSDVVAYEQQAATR